MPIYLFDPSNRKFLKHFLIDTANAFALGAHFLILNADLRTVDKSLVNLWEEKQESFIEEQRCPGTLTLHTSIDFI